MAAGETVQHLQEAIDLHQRGQLADAERFYRLALQAAPEHIETIHRLGMLLGQTARPGEAVAMFERIVGIQPQAPEGYANLGLALQRSGENERAIAVLQQAIALRPTYVEALLTLGTALRALERFDESARAYARAIEINPRFVPAHVQLGDLLVAQRKFGQAIDPFTRATQLKPNHFRAWAKLGGALQQCVRFDAAIAAFERSLATVPDQVDVLWNYGVVLANLGRYVDAIVQYDRLIEKTSADDPQSRAALAAAYANRGNALKDLAMIPEALGSHSHAVALAPENPEYLGNQIFTMHYDEGATPQQLLVAHRHWNDVHAAPLAPKIHPLTNDRSPNRPLRIGYVSPDLRNHPVGRYLLPVFRRHDRSRFHITAYSHTLNPGEDSIRQAIRAEMSSWREIADLPDEAVADLIRADGIDILLDLAGYTAGGRLLVFARKPAPVQVSYMGYANTTGVSTMDYRLTDVYLDPPGMDDSIYSERSIRLPETYWVYQPDASAPAVSSLPAERNAFVTFSCLNNFCKTSRSALLAWSAILRSVPDSRLRLYAPIGSHRQKVLDLFAEQGVDPRRISCEGRTSMANYLATYGEVDIALDPFPYTGYTTSFDALWMGVPIVSLAGATAAWRGGASILGNLGLSDLVADSVEKYVEIAIKLAGDRARLNLLRAKLRGMMQASAHMNPARFTLHLEAAFRRMWQEYCAQERPR